MVILYIIFECLLYNEIYRTNVTFNMYSQLVVDVWQLYQGHSWDL